MTTLARGTDLCGASDVIYHICGDKSNSFRVGNISHEYILSRNHFVQNSQQCPFNLSRIIYEMRWTSKFESALMPSSVVGQFSNSVNNFSDQNRLHTYCFHNLALVEVDWQHQEMATCNLLLT